MSEHEVIIVDLIPEHHYRLLVQKSIKYALISKPFTIRRIGNQTLEQAILNIFKGKLAELLFSYFCVENQIPTDWESCSTPFWQIDQRDFQLNQQEWDLKNNFIYHSGDVLSKHSYTNLPALIPNRKSGDQWDSRNDTKNKCLNVQGVSYLFTFLKASDLDIDGKRGKEFYDFHISKEQLEFIKQLEEKYQGLPTTSEPFTAQWFDEELQKRGSSELITLHFNPSLVITGFADEQHWNLFKNTGAFDQLNHYQKYIKPYWYRKSPNGSCNFLNGTLWTTITNATCPVALLTSFISLYPKLAENIKCGRLK